MRVVSVVLLVLVGGCVEADPIGPDPQVQERAFAVAWEGLLRMERSSRPNITWYDTDCRHVEWMGHIIKVNRACQDSIIEDDGNAQVAWVEKAPISLTDFPVVLNKWHSWLTSGTWGDVNQLVEKEKRIRDELVVAGL